jgi:hypothetical protein
MRWQYPSNLIAMARAAQQLADVVFGPPAEPALGSPLPQPRLDGHDSDALDSPLGLALIGPLGDAAVDGGVGTVGSDAGPFPGVVPQQGAYWTFQVSSAVAPVAVNPPDSSSYVESMTAYLDPYDGGTPHVYGSYRGGNALIELDPRIAYDFGILEIH